jgi:hypothetical protein
VAVTSEEERRICCVDGPLIAELLRIVGGISLQRCRDRFRKFELKAELLPRFAERANFAASIAFLFELCHFEMGTDRGMNAPRLCLVTVSEMTICSF